jgi:hypothetical protein
MQHIEQDAGVTVEFQYHFSIRLLASPGAGLAVTCQKTVSQNSNTRIRYCFYEQP